MKFREGDYGNLTHPVSPSVRDDQNAINIKEGKYGPEDLEGYFSDDYFPPETVVSREDTLVIFKWL